MSEAQKVITEPISGIFAWNANATDCLDKDIYKY